MMRTGSFSLPVRSGRHDPRLGLRAAGHPRRHPRFLEDRGRAPDDGVRAGRPAAAGGGRVRRPAAGGGGEARGPAGLR